MTVKQTMLSTSTEPVPAMSPSAADRRRLITCLSAGGLAVGVVPAQWSRPLVDSVLLPAHAQTTTCVTNSRVSGPLLGHPSKAENCQDACEAQAMDQGAQLCEVTETMDDAGAVQCACDLQM